MKPYVLMRGVQPYELVSNYGDTRDDALWPIHSYVRNVGRVPNGFRVLLDITALDTEEAMIRALQTDPALRAVFELGRASR